MRLPPELLVALEPETSRFDGKRLARAAADLTGRYKSESYSSPVISSEVHRAAYLAVRLPATYAANRRVFSEIRALAPHLEISSMLDLGAGPGTALFAAAETFPHLEQATLIEADAAWFEAGKRLSRSISVRTQWLQHDLRSNLDFSPHDLVVISYALGEIPAHVLESLLYRAWRSARKLLVIVEPGTMRGFSNVNTARSWLIAHQARLIAPCPHHNTCPMAATGDWCHFAQRLERTSLHRLVKGGELGHEDEKFSYVAAGREAVAPPRARIVRHPRKHSGHVQLTLCTAEGLRIQTVTKSQRQPYKQARGAAWGDVWND
jgi:ribosomal protein RSM22 (predicted rRNA methylase)